MTSAKTIAIGDIHGNYSLFCALWEKLPELTADDTVVFLGDYIDRGPASREVVERLRRLSNESPARIVALMGNHERMLLDAYERDECGPLLPPSNGCLATYVSFTGEKLNAGDADQLLRRLKVREWLPADVYEWMASLPLWYEDERAVYVHAGLEGEGEVWFPANESKEGALLWMREDDFWKRYSGKRLVFGHTNTSLLPLDHLNFIEKMFDDKKDVWFRGDLIGIDTGCGKGGFLSAVELPSLKVYESR